MSATDSSASAIPPSTESVTTSPPAPKVHDKWGDTSCDTILCSSDGVQFYVQSYMLMTHSVALRDMLQTVPKPVPDDGAPPQRKIPFSDPEIEDSSAIALFLSATELEPLLPRVSSFSHSLIPTLEWTLRFARKWDCPIALRVIEDWLCALACTTNTIISLKFYNPLDLFVLSSLNQMPIPASMVIQHFKPHNSQHPSSPQDCAQYSIVKRLRRWGRLGCADWLSPRNFERRAWESIPGDFLWALHHCRRGTAEGMHRAKEFLRLIGDERWSYKVAGTIGDVRPSLPSTPDPDRAPSIHTQWNDIHCDTVLISSDNVKFFIDSYAFCGQSSRINALYKEAMASSHSPQSPTEIALIGPHGESSGAIAVLLSALNLKPITDVLKAHKATFISAFSGALRFARQYECRMILRVMEDWLCSMALNSDEGRQFFQPLDCFVLAAQNDMTLAASMLLEHYRPHPHPTDDKASASAAAVNCRPAVVSTDENNTQTPRWGRLACQCKLNIDHLQKGAWEEIPGKYLWALMKTEDVEQGQARSKAFSDLLGGGKWHFDTSFNAIVQFSPYASVRTYST
ncbi:hypothetical protein L198_08075 [Cryptococcus wingfieldii CBS 7118]|uniref:BTB domain-containing protein n=1 Tax=Cryptococcus wingfieldii CBS 7118 TaxID=1295528 RepID=A0A1E3HJF3_9TREE|nr:hypothetical protein L198_08075 [Cryptococcus wingfieldii CBS 7118]ODN76479.1 hypothetical protein L198_08075 [Cryptococcus wingfieldii CBS 7118]